MSTLGSESADRNAPHGTSKRDQTRAEDEESKSTFLRLTTEAEPTIEDHRKEDVKSSLGKPPDAAAGKDTAPVLATADRIVTESVPNSKATARISDSIAVREGEGEGANASTSSIWTSAAATFKNLVMGKPQPPIKGIVTVVSSSAIKRDGEQGVESQAPILKTDKGKGKAQPIDAIEVPPSPLPASHAGSISVSVPPTQQRMQTALQTQQRPSAPPPKLSSIAHSLPTAHATVPPPQPQSSSDSTSIQSPQSATSNQTATSATTATDEENQTAALTALNAVIQSVGTGYTQPLTSRAAQLHANDLQLAQQREKLLHTTNLLAKDTAALQKLALESNNKLKGFGDLSNWSRTLDNDLNAIEETLRIVDRGQMDICAKCEQGIGEEEEQRWCRVCGKGFHRGCAPEDPHEPSQEHGDEEEEERTGAQGRDVNQDNDRQIPQPHELPLPDSLPESSHEGLHSVVQSTSPPSPPPPQSLFKPAPAATSTQPSVPKPSSMFEWGGIPDAIRDVTALRDGDGSESGSGSWSGSGSEWSGDYWRCQECRLKDDLEGIVMGL